MRERTKSSLKENEGLREKTKEDTLYIAHVDRSTRDGKLKALLQRSWENLVVS